MTVYRVEVEREEPTRLAKTSWVYAYTGYSAALMLDRLVTWQRPTTRHKYKATGIWANSRDAGSSFWGVPKIAKNIPPDVAAEARTTWVAAALANGVEGSR